MNGAQYRYLLDTNIISDMVRNPAGRAAAALAEIDERHVCTSIIVVCEIRFGVTRRGSARLAAQVETVLSALPVLAFEEPADHRYGELRARLASEGRIIGSNDLLIAAHALALDLTLITDNVSEFSRVPELRLDNWLAPACG